MEGINSIIQIKIFEFTAPLRYKKLNLLFIRQEYYLRSQYHFYNLDMNIFCVQDIH